MGIHGLWRLLEPAGRDVTLESLENKVLAIDVSLWMYQAQQGSSHASGAASGPNTHLLTLFHRISKLLFYRIKPVFIFDGVAPDLKKKTIFARKQRKQVAGDQAKEMRQQLLLSLAKSGVLGTNPQLPQADKSPSPRKGGPKKSNVAEEQDEDLYKLPPIPENAITTKEDQHSPSEESLLSDEDDNLMSYCEVEGSTNEAIKSGGMMGKVQGGYQKWTRWVDPHEVDLQSEGFKALPIEMRREILTDLKEARKESSWGRIHRMPKELGNFASFQMTRLLHRRKVQEVLEQVEQEYAKSEVHGASLGEVEAILAEKGVTIENTRAQTSQRIASDENKGFILLSGLKDQKKAGEEFCEKKADPGKLTTLKEEPVDFDASCVKECAYESSSFDDVGEGTSKWSVNQELKYDDDDGHKISQPTLTESEMLSSNSRVKQFVMSVTDTPEAETTGNTRGIFERITNILDEETDPDDLSQGEIMAIIKNQAVKESIVSSTHSVCEQQVSEQASKDETPFASNPNKDEVKENESLAIGGLCEDDETGGLTQEQMMKIICDQKSSAVAVETVKTGTMPEETVAKRTTPDSEYEVASNQITPSITDDEVIIVSSSKGSESEESDFLEVEECGESSASVNVKSHSVAPVPVNEVTSAKADNPSESPTDKNLEVVIDVNSHSDGSDDIFSDVFENKKPEKSADSEMKKPILEDVVDVSILGNEQEEKEDHSQKSIEPENRVACTKETSESDSDISSKAKGKALKDPDKETVLTDDAEIMTEEERYRLTLEMRKREREANAGVTERARLESQELLGLFGVPWIVAPFEAEAQCAFLESVAPKNVMGGGSGGFSRSLVEGTVTEDSDVWAFGASRVYRHVFDRRRTRVRVYTMDEVHRKLGLNRIQVVQLALLTGSDYTVGLPGIGTVTALEILAAFPGEKDPHSSSDSEVDDAISGLQHFCDWWRRIERNEKEGTLVGHSYFDPPGAVAKTLRRRLSSCWKAVEERQPGSSLLPPGFPSRAVVKAYLKPSVDECRDTFTWLKPDEAALRSYARVHFGWTKERIDSILRPLFARLKLSDCVDRRQTSLHSYFSHINAMSKTVDVAGSTLGFRTQKALERIAGKCEELESSSPEKKGKVVRVGDKNESEKAAAVEEESAFDEDDFGRRGNTGKLQLLKKKYAKEINKNKKSGDLKLSSSTDAGTSSKSLTSKNRLKAPKESVVVTGFASSLYSNDKIPQREKDNASALQSKLKAIEVMRKSSIGRGKRVASRKSNAVRNKKLKREEVCLSESSESD